MSWFVARTALPTASLSPFSAASSHNKRKAKMKKKKRKRNSPKPPKARPLLPKMIVTLMALMKKLKR